MNKKISTLQEFEEKVEIKRNNPDKRDAAEKVPTGEVLHTSDSDLSKFDENPGDASPNTSVPAGKYAINPLSNEY